LNRLLVADAMLFGLLSGKLVWLENCTRAAFIECFHAEDRHERTENERFKGFGYDELLKRDKVSLDIFWLRDESLEDSANLPDPDVLALEIAEELEAALEQFAAIAENLKR
jgi:type I restriction enzyme M protein